MPCCGIGGGGLMGRVFPRSLAIPDELPVGAVQRAHFHQMQTNAEATDFILYQMDFVGQTAELTPDGKDKINEIGARMRSAPFPVLVERTLNNADPELDPDFQRDLRVLRHNSVLDLDRASHGVEFRCASGDPGSASCSARPQRFV